jgi:hypothetical protein
MASRFVRSDGTGLGEKVAPGATKAQPQRGPSPLKATTNTLDSSGRSALLAQPALMREERLRAREDANGGANGKAHVQGEESGAGLSSFLSLTHTQRHRHTSPSCSHGHSTTVSLSH